MDECLQVLDERKECSNDEILVQQVQLQLIVEKVALGTMHDREMKSIEQTGEPPFLYLENLRSQLRYIKTKILAQLQTDSKLLCTDSSVVLTHISAEVVLLHLYSTELETAPSPRSLHTNQLTFEQQQCLAAYLDSVKCWFDVFFTITPAAYIALPFSIFSQLFRCLSTLSRLTTVNNPSWNENDVWKTADSPVILDRVINNLEQAAIVAGLDNSESAEREVFSSTAQMFRSLRKEWEAKLGLDDLSAIPIPENVNEGFPPDALAVEFFDNDWLMDLLSSQNF